MNDWLVIAIRNSSPMTCNFSVFTCAGVHVASAQRKICLALWSIGAARKLLLLVKNSPSMAVSNTLNVSQSMEILRRW